MSSWRPVVAAGAALCALSAAPWLLIGSARRTHRPAPSALPVLGQVPAFELTDASGRRVGNSDIQGPWVASFLYTRCAAECPTLTGRLKALAGRLPGLRLVSFSVDPADTPEALARYARFHRAGWTFLAGRKGEVARLSREGFRLSAEGGGGKAPLHSSKLVLVDAAGRIRGYYDSEDPEALEELARRAAALAGGSGAPSEAAPPASPAAG